MTLVAIETAEQTAMAVQLLARGFPAKPASTWTVFLERMARLGSNAAAAVPLGYLLTGKDGQPTGVMITPASLRRRNDESLAPVVNLSSWYVEPHDRWRAPRMFQNVLKRHDAMFTDLTPTDEVQAMLPAFGFVPANRGIVVTALPVAAALPADDARVSGLSDAHAALLPGRVYDWLEAHRTVGCLPALLETRSGVMAILFRRRMLKGAPAAKLIYCQDLAALHAALPAVARFLLKQGVAFLMSDDHGLPLRAGQLHRQRGLKFFKPGAGLVAEPGAIDHTASELALLDF